MGSQSSRVAPAGVVPSVEGGVVVNVVNVARSECPGCFGRLHSFEFMGLGSVQFLYARNKSGAAVATMLLDQNDDAWWKSFGCHMKP